MTEPMIQTIATAIGLILPALALFYKTVSEARRDNEAQALRLNAKLQRYAERFGIKENEIPKDPVDLIFLVMDKMSEENAEKDKLIEKQGVEIQQLKDRIRHLEAENHDLRKGEGKERGSRGLGRA